MSTSGSPPRMRGKVVAGPKFPSSLRITPAYAGKRRTDNVSWEKSRDHPRVCGEKVGRAEHAHAFQGSPPRMRGKGTARNDRARNHGITPAYAGKRRFSIVNLLSVGDHPRVCGEKLQNPRFPRRGSGSPPRMRGKGYDRPPYTLPRGITPAYAGKRLFSLLLSRLSRDHPRVCGEKTKKIP